MSNLNVAANLHIFLHKVFLQAQKWWGIWMSIRDDASDSASKSDAPNLYIIQIELNFKIPASSCRRFLSQHYMQKNHMWELGATYDVD